MTGRLPFDPSKMKAREDRLKGQGAPAAAAAPQGPTTLSVSALAAVIDGALKSGVPAKVRVIGEVSGFRDRTHWYFDVKDANAVISCAMFQSLVRRAGFVPANGQEVVLTGRIDFYAKAGKVSLLVEKIEPVGAGALELAYRRLCEELRTLGWFEQARKRPLPAFPRKIGVVTSRSAAALQDVLVTMKRRCPAVGVVLADVRVQGEGAAAEVANAVRKLSAEHERLGIDAVLVTRGGGSMEDLWAFNERVVAEAIVQCRVPVVAAIGHETDTTIAELVADERCATPTQAAVRLTPDGAALLRQLDATQRRLAFAAASRSRAGEAELNAGSTGLVRAAEARMHRARAAIDRLAVRLERNRPQALHARMKASVESLGTRLKVAVESRLRGIDLNRSAESLARAASGIVRERATRLLFLERQLKAVGPQAVLERGFSVTLRSDGRAVRSANDARPGERVTTRLADGEFGSVVEGGATLPARPPGPAKRTSVDSSQGPGLFGG